MAHPDHPASVVDRSIGPDRTLPRWTRARLRVRHTGRLAREVGRLGTDHGLWWMVVLISVVMLAAVATAATTTALPVAVYTLF